MMKRQLRLVLLLAAVVSLAAAAAARADVFRSVLDDCESDTWTFTHDNAAFAGTYVNGYDSTAVHSPVRALRQVLAGGNAGQDGDAARAVRTFPVTRPYAPDSLYVWFQADPLTGNANAYAAWVIVRALDEEGVELGSHTWCLYVHDDWGGMYVQPWTYVDEPVAAQEGAPDYSRDPGGSLQPPAGWWYRLGARLDDGLAVDWSQAATVEVSLVLRGVATLDNTFGFHWDDLLLVSRFSTAAVACDDMESAGWIPGHLNPEFNGSWSADTTNVAAHSPTRSLQTVLGGGYGGRDWDRIWGERTLAAESGRVPDTLTVWFRRQGWPLSGELQGAALVEVTALDGSSVELAGWIGCVAVYDNTGGGWQHRSDWVYLEERPAVYEPGAPDYQPDAEGNVLPPEGWWYRLDVPLRSSLDVADWRLVSAVRVRLGCYGAWLAGNTVSMLWDDACLGSSVLPAQPACDDMESRSPAWTASHDNAGYSGAWNVVYTTADAHSDSTSLAIGLTGGGFGSDHDVVRATRDFPLHGDDVPSAVGAWFCCTSRHPILGQTQQAALLAVSAVDGAGQVLGTVTWCIFVDDNVGNWENRADWHYVESRPDEYEPGAPDYGRGADGSIQPPLNWWYRVTVPTDSLAVDWSQAAALRVQFIAQGAYLWDNDGFWLDWDDVCLEDRWLTGTPPAAPPTLLVMEPNTPNPFNPRTVLRFRTAAPGPVTVAVYDVAGRLVTELWRGVLAAGEHAVPWDGRDRTGRMLSAGVYYGVVRCRGTTAARPMLMLK